MCCVVLCVSAQSTSTKNASTKNTSTKPTTTKSTVKSTTNSKKYSFLGSYTMTFEAKDAKGKTTTAAIKSAFDDYKMATLPFFSDQKDVNIRTVFNVQNNTMTMLIDDVKKKKKSGMVMKMPKVIIANKPYATDVTYTIKKTTEKKVIDGYTCYKWIISYSNNDECEAWVTTELSINTAEAVSYCIAGMKGKQSSVNFEAGNVSGATLESLYKAADGSSVSMKLSNIVKGKPSAEFFSENGYDVIDVTGVQFMK